LLGGEHRKQIDYAVRCVVLKITPDSGQSKDWFDRWIAIIYEALSCLDKEKNMWAYLPNSGGYYDQDEFLMTVWETVRISYITAIRDPNIIHEIEKENSMTSNKIKDELNKIKRKK
jgi:hypothetical protein